MNTNINIENEQNMSKILILSVPIQDEEKQSTEMFIFTILCGASKAFLNALNAFIKPFEAP